MEPRSADELMALWDQADAAGTPVLTIPEPEVMASVPVPLGESAAAATVAGVTATVQEALTCFNAGDIGRALALVGDDLTRQFSPDPAQTPDDVRADLEAPPDPVPTASAGRGVTSHLPAPLAPRLTGC